MDVPSMYAEDDCFTEEFTQTADIRYDRAGVDVRYVQYAQPSLNGT